jgi:Kdo2-lipid IVA lauroyltransferase/acyltransferase
MPFFMLYGVSDILFLLIYYIIGYRKKVVFANLRNSFPEKSEKEIRKIALKYYHNLCDIVIEVCKAKTISEKKMLSRMEFRNVALIDKLYDEGRSVLLVCGHTGNWEWLGMAVKSILRHKGFAVVKPLSSDFWEKYMSKQRVRFAKEGLIPFKQTFRVLVKNKEYCTLTIIAGDQTPTKSEIEYWTTFLNQDTPVFIGTEKIAKALNMAVVFCNIQRIKRGYYSYEFSLLTDDPKNTTENEITEMHVRALEKIILEHPDNWLWSHRRWKHKRENSVL